MNLAERCARHYAGAGYAVFPLRRADKVPLPGFKWRDESTCDPATIDRWAERYPDANWGCDLGKSGLLCIDVDCKTKQPDGGYVFTIDGYQNFLSRVPGGWSFDGHLTVGTGSGGWHWWVRQPDPPLRAHMGQGSAAPLGRHVDVKSVGGFVLVPGCYVPPPLQHPLADGMYRPEAAAVLDPQPCPWWLRDLLTGPEPDPVDAAFHELGVDWERIAAPAGGAGGGAQRLSGLARTVAAAPAGGRNTALNWAAWRAAGGIRDGEFTRQQVEQALTAAAAACGLVEDDGEGSVRATIASGLKGTR